MSGPVPQRCLDFYHKVESETPPGGCLLHGGALKYEFEFSCAFCKDKQKSQPSWMCYFLDPDVCRMENPHTKQFKCTCPIISEGVRLVRPNLDEVEIYQDERGGWQCRFKPIRAHADLPNENLVVVPRSYLDRITRSYSSDDEYRREMMGTGTRRAPRTTTSDALRMMIREELKRERLENEQMEAVD